MRTSIIWAVVINILVLALDVTRGGGTIEQFDDRVKLLLNPVLFNTIGCMLIHSSGALFLEIPSRVETPACSKEEPRL